MSKKDKNIFSVLSKNARDSLRFAAVISKDLFVKEVTPKHIFMSILLNKESLGSKVLLAIGVDIDQTVSTIVGGVSISNFPQKSTEKEILLSKESKKILRLAYSFASKFSHVYVGTEHILLAILTEKDLDITKILNDGGLHYKMFEESLLNYATYPVGILSKPSQVVPEDPNGNQLATVGQDLVALAKDGQFDPLVGREKELDNIINILSRRKKNNPLIVGEAGVGKTALIEGLAQRIADNSVPNNLRGTKLVSLDLTSIMAGSKLRGDIEEKMMNVIKEVVSTPDTVLFIDEIHNIIGTNYPGGGLDIASILKPALVRGDFRVIGATTMSEYTRYMEEDNALVRRFQPVVVEETNTEDAIEILKRIAPMMEKHHNVKISQDAIVSAVKLSHRYVSDRYLPDKAIDLLDEAAAARRLAIEVKYQGVVDIMAEYRRVVRKKEDAIIKGKMEEAERWKEREEEINKELLNMEKSRTRIKQSKKYEVDVDAVQTVVSKWTGIPVTTLSEEETSTLRNLEDTLEGSVIGQDDAVKAVAAAIKRARTGISAQDRPWASFLFLGPTGVGKTELAKVLTKVLFGEEDRLIQVDMSEMMEMHSVSKLIGSPPGYVGYREGGQLTEKIRRQPHSVILFDEIEKAHIDVLNILLQILEYGHLTDSKGRRVNFKNTVIILTSNIGAEEIRRDKILGFADESDEKSEELMEQAYEEMKDELMKELKMTLRPELLNRLDDIVIFRSLKKRDAIHIVNLLIGELNERLEEQCISVHLNKKAKDYVVEKGFSDEYGARPLRRTLQDSVESVLANYILDNGESIKKNKEKKKMLEIEFTEEKDKLIIEGVTK